MKMTEDKTNGELPEFIQGIATKKSEITQRRAIIKKEYLKLLDRLGKKNGKDKHFVHNDFLNVDVWIIKRESEKKASNVSVYNWQSTYAVLHLETIIKKAIAREGEPIYSLPKNKGKQADFDYCNIAILYYDFVDVEKWYMNFSVKLMLGIKNNGKYVQYSVLKTEIKNKNTLSST